MTDQQIAVAAVVVAAGSEIIGMSKLRSNSWIQLLFQGLQLIMLGDGGLYRVDVPEILALMNSNMPDWAGWLMVVVKIKNVMSYLLTTSGSCSNS